MLEEEYEKRRSLPRHLRPPAPPEPGFAYGIRSATVTDVPSVREIYNHYVLNSSVTFDEHPASLASIRQRWETTQKLGFPFLVAESPSGQLLGFAYVIPLSQRANARRLVEDLIYLGPAASGRGLGRALLGELLDRAKAAGVKSVTAVIADTNAEASIRLHEGFGFRRVGTMGRVGYKFGRWLGTIVMEKRY
jgi:phosphinothricin acetyltransferase